MAQKYFTYKNASALNAAAQELHIDAHVQASTDTAPLMTPVLVGQRKVGNRFAVQPMEGCDGDAQGRPGTLTLRRWKRFGAGGFKVIWGEAVAISDESRANSRQLWIHSGSTHEIAKMVDATRAAHRAVWGANACDDLLIGCQITHSADRTARPGARRRHTRPRPRRHQDSHARRLCGAQR
jgi:NADPH2 dehydrogenase